MSWSSSTGSMWRMQRALRDICVLHPSVGSSCLITSLVRGLPYVWSEVFHLMCNVFWPEKLFAVQTARPGTFHSLLIRQQTSTLNACMNLEEIYYMPKLEVCQAADGTRISIISDFFWSRRWECTRKSNKLPRASINKVETATGSSNEVWKVLTWFSSHRG